MGWSYDRNAAPVECAGPNAQRWCPKRPSGIVGPHSARTPPDVSDVPVVITEPDLVETPSEVCWASVILKIADAPLVLQGSLGSQLPASAPNGTNGDVGAWVHTGGLLAHPRLAFGIAC